MKRWLFLILCLFAVSGAYAQMTAYQDLLEGNKDYAAKDYQNALVNYQAAAAANANYGVAFQGVGNCQLILGNKAAALAAYQTSLSLKPITP
jgi:tetratricopeptide (TPR) repeat protein